MAIKYFIKQYQLELITLVTAIVSYVLTFIFSNDQLLTLIISISITFIITLILIWVRIKERAFYYIPLTKRSEKDDWMGQGIFEYKRTEKAYQITESYSGFLFSKCLNWTDYEINFDFKIINSCLGVIVRAFNLSNLVMLQISDKKIRPHIRINQAWNDKFDSLNFDNPLILNKWYGCKIICDKSEIKIQIFKYQKLKNEKHWTIPGGMINFEYKRPEITEPEAIIPFSINLDYGTIGFRNDATEKAVVKNLVIKRI